MSGGQGGTALAPGYRTTAQWPGGRRCRGDRGWRAWSEHRPALRAETDHRSIAAPVVVDAAGGWVRQVADLAGARVPVAMVRHQLGLWQYAHYYDPVTSAPKATTEAPPERVR